MDCMFLSYIMLAQHAIYLICLSVALILKNENCEIQRFVTFAASLAIRKGSITINFIFFETFHQKIFAYRNVPFEYKRTGSIERVVIDFP